MNYPCNLVLIMNKKPHLNFHLHIVLKGLKTDSPNEMKANNLWDGNYQGDHLHRLLLILKLYVYSGITDDGIVTHFNQGL